MFRLITIFVFIGTIINFTLCLFDNKGNIDINYNTIYALANMSYNVYLDINDTNKHEVNLINVQNISLSDDAVKAYLFSNEDYSINVISIKGTSLYWLYNNFENMTTKINDNDNRKIDNEINIKSSGYNDKYNDNLFLSCCFYKENSIFKNFCENDINKTLITMNNIKNVLDQKSCSKKCYEESLNLELNYFNIGKKIVDNIKTNIIKNFDNTNIIFTGHSLGGVLATMLGLYYNKPVVTFETPGELHYIKMSNMFKQPLDKVSNIYHFGHNADPIFIGDCGYTCSVAGYSVDTKCHIGYTCMYDAKGKLGFSESILNHRMDYVINNVIGPKWNSDFPECKLITDCNECELYKYE